MRLFSDVELIFSNSGDDHDYCDYTHNIVSQGGSEPRIREVTLKSFSMVMGIRRPGFQLLSLATPTGAGPSHADALCLLPDQLGIYLSRYLPLFICSLLALIVQTIRDLSKLRSDRQRLGATVIFDEAEEDNTLEVPGFHPKRDSQMSPESSVAASFFITMRTTAGNGVPPSFRASRPASPLTPDIWIPGTTMPYTPTKLHPLPGVEEEQFNDYSAEDVEKANSALGRPRRESLSRSFVFCGRRWLFIKLPSVISRIFLSSRPLFRRGPISPITTRKSMNRRSMERRNNSAIGFFVSHFRSVAWLPVSLFVVINLFMLF